MATEDKSKTPSNLWIWIIFSIVWFYALELGSRINKLDAKIEQLRQDTGIIHAK